MKEETVQTLHLNISTFFNVPILISLGSNLGGMLSLSSVRLELVRVSDEPGFGTTDLLLHLHHLSEKGKGLRGSWSGFI